MGDNLNIQAQVDRLSPRKDLRIAFHYKHGPRILRGGASQKHPGKKIMNSLDEMKTGSVKL
jgi:hypothetical protein